MAKDLTTFEATVAKVSETGFKVHERETWLTWSKFAPDKITPPVGARVAITVDGRAFVQHIEYVEPVKTAPVAPPAVPAPASATPEPATASSPASTIIQDDRGVVVTRLATLNTATAILSSGGRAANPDEVLALAGRLEVWGTR